MKKVLVTTLASVTLVCLAIVSSMGLPVYEPTQALIGYGMTIKLDGEEVQLHDVTGKRVYPLVRDGTTCIPVRGVSELLGLNVDWDGETNTVLLGVPVPVQSNFWTGADETGGGMSRLVKDSASLLPDSAHRGGVGIRFSPEAGGRFSFHSDESFSELSFTAHNAYNTGDITLTVVDTGSNKELNRQVVRPGEVVDVKCSVVGTNEVQVNFDVPKDTSRYGYAVAAGVSVS